MIHQARTSAPGVPGDSLENQGGDSPSDRSSGM